ncbi:hypothetical protein [Halosimplex sp. TS25]|uniref:hypothetical protein n=1 Tax=Halosimplex rarum TaxID=3396619 RepID=UPI0039E76D0F
MGVTLSVPAVENGLFDAWMMLEPTFADKAAWLELFSTGPMPPQQTGARPSNRFEAITGYPSALRG